MQLSLSPSRVHRQKLQGNCLWRWTCQGNCLWGWTCPKLLLMYRHCLVVGSKGRVSTNESCVECNERGAVLTFVAGYAGRVMLLVWGATSERMHQMLRTPLSPLRSCGPWTMFRRGVVCVLRLLLPNLIEHVSYDSPFMPVE